MYRLQASIEPVTSSGTEELGATSPALEAVASTYDDALAALHAQVPTGWRLLALLPDYDRVVAHLHGRPYPPAEGT